MASSATGRASLDAPDRDGFRWPVQKEWDAIESAFSREHLRRLYPQAYEHPAYAARFCDRHQSGSKARLALALLLFTGARRGDIVTLGRQHVKAGWLRFVPRKTIKTSSEAVEVPVLPELQAEIEAAPVTGLTFLLTEYGKPFTAAGFGGWFKDRCKEAGLPHCAAHGLRKAGASMAAENGATEEQLRAIFNWSTAKQSATYTRRARRRILTASLGELIKIGEQ